MSPARKKTTSIPQGFTPWLGVFETLRVSAGEIEFAKEHFASLKTAARALGLKVQASLRDLSAQLPRPNGRLRWIVEPQQTYAIFSEEAKPVKKAFSLELAAQRLGSANWDALYKTLSYLTHWQARHSVVADEALLLNENSAVASGAMANIFWVRDGKIFTPSLRAGCRAGVVRAWVLRQRKVREGIFQIEALDHADEIFLTNSWIGIRPVNRWGHRALKIGPVTRALQAGMISELNKR
jgi:4-amino-4-deoxychorismate lyase